MKNLRIILFGLLALGQLAFAAQLILGREEVLREGKVYRFKTAPIDPNDPFRGKFVRLDFEQTQYTDSLDTGWWVGQEVYVQLATDPEGYATLAALWPEAEQAGPDHVKAHIHSISEIKGEAQYVTIRYPFDRYYLEESKAPEAERRYRESGRDSSITAYAQVRILDGEAVLEEVFVDGKPLREWAGE